MRQAWTWLLAGALAASLQWNVRHSGTEPSGGPTPTEADAVHGTPVAPPAECVLAPETLGLSEEQTRQLSDTCRSICRQAEEAEAKAAARQADLLGFLAREEVDEEELRALVAEVSELRARSLEACVESILEVRRVLSHEQVGSMLSSCCQVEGFDR